jgi:hypothetical protein
MKATLSYTLPDEDREFRLALQGADAVRKLCETLRAKIPSEMLDI